MKRTRGISFNLDSLEWYGGVSDNFSSTPLGMLSKPLKIEEIADVEWTIVQDNFIAVVPIDHIIQIKYWIKIPEKIREKIKSYSENIFPFTINDIKDRYLIAYSVQNEDDKFIGFIFESMLKSSKASLYVYTQSKIKTDKEAKIFLEDYLYEIYQRDINNIKPEEYKMTLSEKILDFFKK
jgi:hypothetical protein